MKNNYEIKTKKLSMYIYQLSVSIEKDVGQYDFVYRKRDEIDTNSNRKYKNE